MNNTRNNCANCFFGKCEADHKCTCHVNRPLKDGWPLVHGDDYCSYWTDPQTLTRPFLVLPLDPWRVSDGKQQRMEAQA